ncbi:MAG TPA: PadR family transcriptional regulator [Methanoregulaceae archaeon]|nr:PadR family transcriptional regulator [Methanoregulaceae archaeon]
MPKIQYPRFIILGLLGLEPMSGYDIKKWVDISFRYFWEIGYGQIYPTLKALEEEGLVTMKIDHEHGGPEKKVYTISAEGLETLKKWLFSPEQKEFEILLKVFFGDKLPPQILKEKVIMFRNKAIENYDALKNVEKFIGNLPESYAAKPYFKMVSSCGIFAYETHRKWAEETLASLDQLMEKKVKSESGDQSHKIGDLYRYREITP